MAELAAAIGRGEREPVEAVVRLAKATVYPRFLGLDESGDLVWELANGRWCFGDDPHQAARQRRTFEPERYVIKYGAPAPIEVTL